MGSCLRRSDGFSASGLSTSSLRRQGPKFLKQSLSTNNLGSCLRRSDGIQSDNISTSSLRRQGPKFRETVAQKDSGPFAGA